MSLFTDRGFEHTPGYERIVAALRGIAQGMGLAGLVIDATGGAVMNACRVLANPPACHFKLPKPQDGGGSSWDYAATACLFEAAGAAVTDIHGNPLELNRVGSTFMNHRGVLFATDPVLAGHIRALYAALGSSGVEEP